MYNLIIKEVKAEDAATYQAEFTNRAGEKKVQVPLIVHCKYLKIKLLLGRGPGIRQLPSQYFRIYLVNLVGAPKFLFDFF